MAPRASQLLDALKLLALVAMTVDHVNVVVFMRSQEPLMLIGRIAFPTFVFAAAFGALRTRAPRRYLMRLCACALLSQPVFYWSVGIDWWYLNTVFTLLSGVAAVLLWRYGRLWLAPLALLPALFADYGIPGAAAVLAAAMMLSSPAPVKITGAGLYALLCPLLWPAANQLLVALPSSALALLLWSETAGGIRPSGPRYLFYVYYPLHLAILALYASWPG